jgi:hypothetical protein
LDHDSPVREAFCSHLFASNGGTFNEKGEPIIHPITSEAEQLTFEVRSMCSHAFDCGTCPLFSQWVEARIAQGWVVSWECWVCLEETRDEDKKNGGRKLTAHYNSGRDPSREPDDPNFDPDRPGLTGCTRCGKESSLLQLVLRNPTGRRNG